MVQLGKQGGWDSLLPAPGKGTRAKGKNEPQAKEEPVEAKAPNAKAAEPVTVSQKKKRAKVEIPSTTAAAGSHPDLRRSKRSKR